MPTSAPFDPSDRKGRVAVLAYTEYSWDPRVRREAEALRQDGYAVHVVSLRPKAGESTKHLDGVHIHEVPLIARRGGKARYLFQYSMFFLLASAELLRLHLRRQIDLVHVHSLPDFLVFAAAPLKVRGIPVILDLHEAMPEIVSARMALPPRSFLVRGAATLEKISVWFADHVIVASDGIRSVVERRGLATAKITTVYNPGDVSPVLPHAAELKHRLSLPDGKLIVHAGGVNPERDLETLLKALAHLPSDESVRLIIAGDGEAGYVKALQRLAETLGVSDRVRYVGKLSLQDAHALMSLSSVGLVTLEHNPLTDVSWPTRIVEFAHLEKPLVVPRLRFIEQILGGAAQYYTPGDPKSLAEELTQAFRAPEDNRGAIERALLVVRRFGWSQMRSQLLAVVRNSGGRHAG